MLGFDNDDDQSEGGFFIDDASVHGPMDDSDAQQGEDAQALPKNFRLFAVDVGRVFSYFVTNDLSPSTAELGPVLARPTPQKVPTVVTPSVCRPTALRPSTSQAMLQKIAQDFEENPPPLASIELVNVPPDLGVKTASTRTLESEVSGSSSKQSCESICIAAATPNGLAAMPTVAAPAPSFASNAPRRTMSESNMMYRPPQQVPEAAQQSFMDAQKQIKELEDQIKNLQKQMAMMPPPAPTTIGGLQKPVAVRPVALRASQSHGMLNQLAQGFNQNPQAMPQFVAPQPQFAAPQPQFAAPQPQFAAPQLAAPQPIKVAPKARPKPRRQNSSRSARKKASWYHRVAAQNRLGSIQEDPLLLSNMAEEDEAGGRLSPHGSIHNGDVDLYEESCLQTAKKDLLRELNRTAKDKDSTTYNTPAFQAALQTLIREYDSSLFDPRAPVLSYHPYQLKMEGIGISAGKPSFPGCIGVNEQGDPMYKLGTMSFEMFRPTELVVSVQGTFCLVDNVDRNNLKELENVPKNLVADVRHGINPVRTYNIVTPFTIEAWRPEFGDDSPNKGVEQPIHGVMTTYGYLLPYPTQNRFSVWFTGGSLEVDNTKNEKWFQIFDKTSAPKRTAFESSKVFAAKLLMGACVNDEMDKDGKLSYTLSRPVASHIDLVYMDESLQVLRGSSGTVYVHVRLAGGSEAVQQSAFSNELLPSPVVPLHQEDDNHMDYSYSSAYGGGPAMSIGGPFAPTATHEDEMVREEKILVRAIDRSQHPTTSQKKMGNTQPLEGCGDMHREEGTLPFPEQDWPWIWAIDNPEFLDWKAELGDDDAAILARAQAQAALPVLISSSNNADAGLASSRHCSVYLSDARHAHDVDLLKRIGITHVLNVAGKVGEGDMDAYRKANIKTKTVDAEDEEGYPMLEKHFDEFQQFLRSSPRGSRIVVHCVAGLNRSGLLVAAHKLLAEQQDVFEVVAHVRRQRGNLAFCNRSFVAQLVALARAHDLLGPEPGQSGCRVSEQAPPYQAQFSPSPKKDFKSLF
eukprot:Sro1724_g293660.2  (1023) ;mRNA; f:1942-5615